MLKLGEVTDDDVVTITASGRLSREDYVQALPKLEAMLAEHGRLRFFIRLEDFSGFEPAAVWEDLKFDFRHRNQMGRTAVVGHTRWEELGTRISDPLVPSEVRFFPAEQSEEAWQWIRA